MGSEMLSRYVAHTLRHLASRFCARRYISHRMKSVLIDLTFHYSSDVVEKYMMKFEVRLYNLITFYAFLSEQFCICMPNLVLTIVRVHNHLNYLFRYAKIVVTRDASLYLDIDLDKLDINVYASLAVVLCASLWSYLDCRALANVSS